MKLAGVIEDFPAGAFSGLLLDVLTSLEIPPGPPPTFPAASSSASSSSTDTEVAKHKIRYAGVTITKREVLLGRDSTIPSYFNN